MANTSIVVRLKYSDNKVEISCYIGDELIEPLSIENITVSQALIYYNGLYASYDVGIDSESFMTYAQMCTDFSNSLEKENQNVE